MILLLISLLTPEMMPLFLIFSYNIKCMNYNFRRNKTRGLKLCPVFHLPLSESVISEMAKIWPYYGQTWSSHCPSNGFILNLNQCAKGWSMPNFTLMDKSCSPFCMKLQKMWLLWPKHGSLMVLQISSSWILINVPGDAPCQISES